MFVQPFASRHIDQDPDPVNRAVAYMVEHYAKPITLDELALEAGISKFKLIRRFQKARQHTPIKWLWNYRILKSIELMKRLPNTNLQKIAVLAGFSSQAHFSRLFKKQLKISPVYYRKLLLEGDFIQPSSWDPASFS